jgi:predicted DNA-binding transcriptional regulator AlpA
MQLRSFNSDDQAASAPTSTSVDHSTSVAYTEVAPPRRPKRSRSGAGRERLPLDRHLLLNADEAGELVGGVSASTWWRLHAAAEVPAPVKLGGGTYWRRAELEAWAAAGCPGRKAWEALQRAGGRR